ncbi:PKD domain-containing protein, partial [Thermodesulfovibrionales bacterium]|nr:PKD domain-containing protein [Thermodesulfovibrionales bacterium]
DGGNGLQIIDISNPRSPVIVGSVDTPGWVIGVFISGNHAFVADGEKGLQIIDVSNPRSPVIIGSVDTPGSAWGVYISGDHAFVADDRAGLQIIDVSAFVGEPIDPPKVIATNPPADAIAAPVTDIITATFSEPIQPGTLAIQMVAEEGAAAPGVKSVMVNNRTLVISLTETLVYGTGYGVLIDQRAVEDADGNPNPAFGWAFVTAAATALDESPELIAPIHQEQEVSVGPMLKWYPVAGADRYLVQVDRDATFADPVFSQVTTSTSIQVSPALDSGTTYFWRVLAAAKLAVGPWSDVRSFTTVDADAPEFVFQVGEKVRVAHTGGLGLRLREAGNLLARVLQMMPEGTEVTILGGPEFADGYTWWKVLYGEQEGWAAARYLARVVGNRPPEPPINLGQLDFILTEIPVGGTTNEDVLALYGLLVDPDGDQVRLEVELRPVGEQGFLGRATHQSKEFVISGAKAYIDIPPLPDGHFRWRARTMDAHGLTSEWVSFGDNYDTVTDFIISAYWPPRALFNYDPAIVVVGETIAFDASVSRDPDDDIDSFHWDFGDGTTAIGKKVNHTFTTEGIYPVTLTVTDARDFTGKRTVEIGVLSRDLYNEINRIVTQNKQLLDNILIITDKLGGVANTFRDEINKAETRIAVQGALGIISLGIGVDSPKVDALARAKKEEAVDAAAAAVIGKLREITEDEVKGVFAELGIGLWNAFVEDDRKIPESMRRIIREKIEHYRQELENLKNKALLAMAELSPEERDLYLKDLRNRHKANIIIDWKYFTEAEMLNAWAQILKDDRESWTYICGRILFNVSLAAGTLAGGLKIKAAGAGYTTISKAVGWGTGAERVVNIIHGILAGQRKDVQIYHHVILAMTDGTTYARNIYQNTAAGLRNIIQAERIIPVQGKIVSAEPYVKGRKELWFGGICDFFTNRAEARVTIKNTNPENTGTVTYYLYARHLKEVSTVGLGIAGWTIVERTYELPIIVAAEPLKLNPGEEKTVSFVFYRNEKGGVIPTGPIFIELMARDNAGGIFWVDTKNLHFGTTFIDEQGNIIPEAEAEGLRILEYPVRSELRYRPGTGDFELTIFFTNHWEVSRAVELEQPVPLGVEVICAGDGIWDQNQNRIVWELNLRPKETAIAQVTLRPQGEAVTLEMPGARLTVHDRINNAWVNFQSSPVERHVPVAPVPDPVPVAPVP